MHEALIRQDQTVKRLFGASAAIGGELGTPSRPGSARIILDGREIGRGPNFQEALTAARRKLARSPEHIDSRG